MVAPRRGPPSSGPYLRSTRLFAPSSIGARMLKQMEHCLTQLGINIRPKICTSSIVNLLDELRNEIVLMLHLKRQVDTLDYEIRVDRERKLSIEKDLSTRGISIQIDPQELKVSD
jgi:hypothetical protein